MKRSGQITARKVLKVLGADADGGKLLVVAISCGFVGFIGGALSLVDSDPSTKLYGGVIGIALGVFLLFVSWRTIRGRIDRMESEDRT